jgi:hypothetical protein
LKKNLLKDGINFDDINNRTRFECCDCKSSIASAYIKTPMTGLDFGAIDNLFGYRFRGGKPGIGRVF